MGTARGQARRQDRRKVVCGVRLMWSSNFCVGESGERSGALYGLPNPLFSPPRDGHGKFGRSPAPGGLKKFTMDGPRTI
jgi:hypothetical protein